MTLADQLANANTRSAAARARVFERAEDVEWIHTGQFVIQPSTDLPNANTRFAINMNKSESLLTHTADSLMFPFYDDHLQGDTLRVAVRYYFTAAITAPTINFLQRKFISVDFNETRAMGSIALSQTELNTEAIEYATLTNSTDDFNQLIIMRFSPAANNTDIFLTGVGLVVR